MKNVNFTKESFKAFKKAYNEAMKTAEGIGADPGDLVLTFEGNEYVLSYAKYMIQYIKGETGWK